jgi:hypothetical protein
MFWQVVVIQCAGYVGIRVRRYRPRRVNQFSADAVAESMQSSFLETKSARSEGDVGVVSRAKCAWFVVIVVGLVATLLYCGGRERRRARVGRGRARYGARAVRGCSVGGLEARFGVFVFEALDHALKGLVKEEETA